MEDLGKTQPTEAFTNMDQAPPGNADQGPYQDPMQRAQSIDGTMQQPGNSFDTSENMKRPFEEIPSEVAQTSKRSMMDGIPGNPPFDVQQAQGQAVAKAAQFLSGQDGPPASAQSVQEEVLKVPNRMVGIIIGRGGETINRLQSESGARIQCAPPDNNHYSVERAITLTGTKEAIASGKLMIQALVEQGVPSEQANAAGGGLIHVNSAFGAGGNAMMGAGGTPEIGGETMEVMIHQSKVGLVIGKGGETIKRLQQQAGCRMQMIQDGPYASAYEKPLRIQGTNQAISTGRDLVDELIRQSEMTPAGQETLEVPVPRELVGMVIGRNGEQIRKIQNETGVRIQFQPELPGRTIRNAILAGTAEGLPKAKVMVEEIVERGRNSTKNISQPNHGAFPGAMGNVGGAGGAGMRVGGGGAFLGPNQVVDMPVPASRCGLIIGRHGETIRALQQESGAHIQLNRNAICGPDEKIFTIGGSPDEIQRAQQLIRQKCEMASTVGGGGGGHHVGRNDFGGQPMMGQMSGQGMYGQQQPQQQGQWGYQMQNQGFNQPSGGGGGNVDAQAWAAYYQQYYNQPNMGAAAAQAASTQQAAAAAAVVAGTAGANPAGSDMQAQWAEYYRQLGYFPGQQQQPSSS